jgi:phosphatidylglycerophosphate synthase
VPSAAPRRPLTTRDATWAKALAGWLARRGARPNAISALSVVAALGAGAALAAAPHARGWLGPATYLTAAVGIQARLLCNLLDGMVAVEHGRRTVTGELWNDVPDRLADALILVGAGAGIILCPWGRDLGWLAATLAVGTAYARMLGGAVGLPQSFAGPMAKPQRMAAMTAACLAAAVIHHRGWADWAIAGGLAVVALGAAWTCARRVRAIAAGLRGSRDQAP